MYLGVVSVVIAAALLIAFALGMNARPRCPHCKGGRGSRDMSGRTPGGPGWIIYRCDLCRDFFGRILSNGTRQR